MFLLLFEAISSEELKAWTTVAPKWWSRKTSVHPVLEAVYRLLQRFQDSSEKEECGHQGAIPSCGEESHDEETSSEEDSSIDSLSSFVSDSDDSSDRGVFRRCSDSRIDRSDTKTRTRRHGDPTNRIGGLKGSAPLYQESCPVAGQNNSGGAHVNATEFQQLDNTLNQRDITSQCLSKAELRAVKEHRWLKAKFRTDRLACDPSMQHSMSLTRLSSAVATVEEDLDFLSDQYVRWHNFRARIAAGQDGRITVKIVGSGPDAVVMLHGICMTGKFFSDGILRHCSEYFLETFTFYVPDLMGYGNSIGVLPNQNYSMLEQVNLIKRDVIDYYHLTTYHLIGHSFGALCCVELAAKNPSAVESITLLAPAYFEKDLMAFSQLVKVPFPANMVVAIPELGRPLIGWLNFFRPYVIPIASRIIPGSEIPAGSVFDFFAQHPDATLGTIQAIVSERVDHALNILANSHTMIFVIHGDEDGIVPLRQAIKLASRYDNILLRTLPGAAHHFPVSHAQLLASILEQELFRKVSQRKFKMTSRATGERHAAFPNVY